jgi:beta-lactam-binding protein with PASTA domain
MPNRPQLKRNQRALRVVMVPLLFLLSFGWNISVRADQTVHLTVRVTDEQGNAISGARVNVYQQEAKRSRYFDVPVPPDYQDETNAQGLARLQIKVANGQDLDLTVEVSREDMQAQSHPINLGKNFPTRLPLEKFALKKRSVAGAGPVITVIVDVQDLEGNPLEGANILIRDSSLGAVTGRFPGTTGADGRATIPVLYGSADSTEVVSCNVSKQGYKDKTIPIHLTQKQVGKTVIGGTAKLEKALASGIKVTVTVRDQARNEGVGDAKVVLDGPNYYTDSTNGSGQVVFYVEPGTFNVRISQDNFRSFTGEMTVLKDEKEKPVTYQLERKATKDEGRDIIEVTVLARDPTDEKSKPTPLAGASVRAGSIGTSTDSNGRATLQGALEERQEVNVQASGYKSQSKMVIVAKTLHYSAGKGSTTFTLDPDLSENSPIRIIVEVQDAAGTKIEGADVEFFSASGTSLRRLGTKKEGQVDFRSSHKPDVPIAELRKGITVNVKKAPEYKEVTNRSVPSNLLQPSLEAGLYVVQLERDWTELEKALGALEARAAALKNEAADAATKASTAETLIAKFPAAKGRVQEMSNELQQAEAAFKPDESKKRCEEVKTLMKQITDAQAEAEKKEGEIRKTLDEAIALSERCNSAADADTIKKRYREAIKAAGEINKLTKSVAEPRQKLSRLATSMAQGGALQKQVQEKLQQIENEVEAAKKDSNTSSSAFVDAAAGAANIPGKRAALVSELDTIISKFDLAKNNKLVPAELKTRFNNLSQLISSISAPKAVPIQRLDEVVKPALADLERSLAQARATAKRFDEALCEVTPMDDAVDEINSHVSGATIELSAAADLEAKADECIKKLSQSPTPAADEVTVPDVKGYTDPSKMVAAVTAIGMKPMLVASTEAPASDGAGVVVRQSPLANAKAKRGDPLTIVLSQKKVAAASPTPTPVAAATPSPKATDEVIVPTVPANVTVAEAKATLSAAGLTAGFDARGGKPSKQDLEFKTTGAQDPPGGSKAKRGSTVTVSIYQKFETASPTPTAAASPTATVALGTMPDLTGLTLDQAVARLPAGMRIGSYEGGDKPPKPELANTIFGQTPAPGAKINSKKPPVVTVKVYGAKDATVGNGPERFDGSYVGSYSGADKGTVRFTVSGGVIAITSPGRGTGTVSQSGSASIAGSGADGNSTYSFSGTFSITNGKASAGGTWSGKQYGYSGTGTWSASRK